jgi:hypothetical protein
MGAALALVAGLIVATPGSSLAAPQHSSAPTCLTGTPSGTMPAPFLKLPFRARDGVASLYDTQGWITSPDELDIDQEVNGDLHGANDLELVTAPDYGYGAPILAAASGRAYFSYQYISGTWTDPAGVTHQVGWGAGLFVEIRHAQDTPTARGWVTQYIHLSRVADGIPYLAPTAVDDPADPTHPDWFPAPITQDDNVLWGLGVPVVQGQVIGYQGDTGIGLDWKDNFDVATGKVASRNRAVLKPWDPPQLHFQLYQGRINGAKQNIVDPFGWYAQTCPGEWKPLQPHVNPYTPFPGVVRVATVSAFLTDAFGHPKYAGL